MVRTSRWKLGIYGDGDGELYDLDDDPSELRNLFHEAAYADVRSELFARYARQTLANQHVRSQVQRTAADPDRDRAIASILAEGKGRPTV